MTPIKSARCHETASDDPISRIPYQNPTTPENPISKHYDYVPYHIIYRTIDTHYPLVNWHSYGKITTIKEVPLWQFNIAVEIIILNWKIHVILAIFSSKLLTRDWNPIKNPIESPHFPGFSHGFPGFSYDFLWFPMISYGNSPESMAFCFSPSPMIFPDRWCKSTTTGNWTTSRVPGPRRHLAELSRDLHPPRRTRTPPRGAVSRPGGGRGPRWPSDRKVAKSGKNRWFIVI